MRLEQISYFMSVAEHGNITAAARALYISQPALSKQITLLEQEIGVPLFRRQARGVSLTQAGLQFQKDLKNILGELETAKENAVLAGKSNKSLFHIGCFDGEYSDDFLPALYEYLQDTLPNRKLVLQKCSFAEGNEAIQKGTIDLWLTLEPTWSASEGFNRKNLIHRKGALIYSSRSKQAKKEHPVLEDFRDETCVLVRKSHSQGLFCYELDVMEELKLDAGTIEFVENLSTQLSYVRLGRGYCFLSEDVAYGNKELQKITLPDALGINIIAVWSEQNKQLSELMETYLTPPSR